MLSTEYVCGTHRSLGFLVVSVVAAIAIAVVTAMKSTKKKIIRFELAVALNCFVRLYSDFRFDFNLVCYSSETACCHPQYLNPLLEEEPAVHPLCDFESLNSLFS
jgi:hypothetical protein